MTKIPLHSVFMHKNSFHITVLSVHFAAMPTEHALCQRSRLERYHQQCANLHHTPPSGAGTGKFTHINSHNDLEALSVNDLKTVVRNIVVDDRHSVLYCAIPKAGCTTWKHYLLQNLPREYDPDEAANQIHNETLAAERGLPFLSKFNQTEIFQRLDTHRKFMVVRHPLDRLVSTYLEKFAGHKRWYKEHTAVKIIKEMRLNPSEHALKYGDDLTFDEFIRFVVKSHHTEPLLDYHWENFAKLCFPCAISYDYIAKLETNTPDAEYIVDKYLEGVHYDKVAVKNQNRNVTHGIWGTGKPLDLYANITDSVYEELVPFYKGDMEMFGYSAERNSKTVIKCSGGESCC